MRFFIFKRKIGVYWRRRAVRGGVAAFVLVVAIILQYFLANTPIELDVTGPSNKATPAIAKSQQEELLIEEPALDANRVLFSLATLTEFVNTHFERAQLTGRSLKNFQEKTPPVPADLQTIDLITEDVRQVLERARAGQSKKDQSSGSSGPVNKSDPPKNVDTGKCRTSVTVEVPDTSPLPTRIHFFLPRTSDSTRDFYMIVDTDLIVTLDYSPSVSENRVNPWTLGCGKYLKVGNWDWHLATSIELKILASPNSILHFTFLKTPDSTWKNPRDTFEPFTLGLRPLRAQAVSVLPLNVERPSTDPSSANFSARIKEGSQPLSLGHFRLNAEEIQLEFSGMAFVKSHGNYVTGDIYDRVKKYRLVAALLAMGDLALVGWFLRIMKGILVPTQNS